MSPTKFSQRLLAILVLSTTCLTGVARAELVMEDFESGELGSDLVVTFNNGDDQNFIIGDGEILFGSERAGDGGRAFIGTAEDNLVSTDFTASVDITIADGGGDNAFFGLGPGTESRFGVPGAGPALFYGFNTDGSVFGADVIAGQSATGGPANGTLGGPGDYTLQLDYIASTQVLSLSATTINDAGDVVPVENLGTRTLDGTDNNFGTTGARIFFGGDDSTSFDNFTVTTTASIPEPSSLALLGAGLMGILSRRRRVQT